MRHYAGLKISPHVLKLLYFDKHNTIPNTNSLAIFIVRFYLIIIIHCVIVYVTMTTDLTEAYNLALSIAYTMKVIVPLDMCLILHFE